VDIKRPLKMKAGQKSQNQYYLLISPKLALNGPSAKQQSCLVIPCIAENVPCNQPTTFIKILAFWWLEERKKGQTCL
jgi:hypothetical protein